jgi:DNA-binding CsgD family transcriptional regulator
MAFTKAAKQKRISGSQTNSREPDKGTNEINSLESAGLPPQDENGVLMDYHGERYIVSIRPVFPANIEVPRLSKRESEVVQCLALGMSPDQTAEVLQITVWMVRKHLDKLEVKFGTTSRDQMMARAGYLRLCNPYKDIA